MFCVKKRVVSKSHDSQIVPKCEYCILHVLLNIFSISLLSRVQDKSGYFEMQKKSSCDILCCEKTNKMQVAS